ncbi:hypothetical protein [Gordonia sp. MP11Mi]|uniref:Uncharacterized protein n=1 Tax=Gordonia sp. MP11Mi TaxID=3022769 RepID=A0AA97CXK6_9ACTN
MTTTLKTRIGAAVAALGIAAGGLVAVAPAQAQAQAATSGIAPGTYCVMNYVYGVLPVKNHATVYHGKLITTRTIGRDSYRIHATRHGGWVDQPGLQRVTYRKTGTKVYRGNIMLGTVPIGTSTLSKNCRR